MGSGFDRLVSILRGKKAEEDKRAGGGLEKTTGAGPALAAHSKDAATPGKSGQHPKATKKIT